jgi:hypothetical protein
MRSFAGQWGRSIEDFRVRFFGYGPGHFFDDNVTDGRGTPLCFPTVFEDDIPLGFVLFALNDPCPCWGIFDAVVSNIIPSMDDGVAEINNVLGDVGWDGDRR